MSNDMMRKEIMEAIQAGERSLISLKRAQELLNSARNWGILDMLGGGFLSTMIKRSKMQSAVNCMEEAKSDLMRFRNELNDVNIPMNLRLDVGGFLSFADFFFDGFVADYLVQSKISEAKSQVSRAIAYVEQTLARLRANL